mmetsp:Transcript_2131/g.3410  ORF Transcript_2131/g.3410 Transcript_2131/m.3410 type:complete len:98 (+) Transcript_2131:733-1026(+)
MHLTLAEVSAPSEYRAWRRQPPGRKLVQQQQKKRQASKAEQLLAKSTPFNSLTTKGYFCAQSATIQKQRQRKHAAAILLRALFKVDTSIRSWGEKVR